MASLSVCRFISTSTVFMLPGTFAFLARRRSNARWRSRSCKRRKERRKPTKPHIVTAFRQTRRRQPARNTAHTFLYAKFARRLASFSRSALRTASCERTCMPSSHRRLSPHAHIATTTQPTHLVCSNQPALLHLFLRKPPVPQLPLPLHLLVQVLLLIRDELLSASFLGFSLAVRLGPLSRLPLDSTCLWEPGASESGHRHHRRCARRTPSGPQTAEDNPPHPLWPSPLGQCSSSRQMLAPWQRRHSCAPRQTHRINTAHGDNETQRATRNKGAVKLKKAHTHIASNSCCRRLSCASNCAFHTEASLRSSCNVCSMRLWACAMFFLFVSATY